MGPKRVAPTDGAANRADDIYQALANRTRRVVLGHISEQDDEVTVESLARAIVAEPAAPEHDGTSDRMLIQLCHVHLPVLKKAGLIEWDMDEQTVAATPLLGQEPLLRQLLTHRFPR